MEIYVVYNTESEHHVSKGMLAPREMYSPIVIVGG